MDSIDHAILRVLQREGRIPNNELAELVGLSPSPCLRRVRRLEADGVITGYRTAIAPESLGWTMTIMAGLRIVKGRMMDVQQRIAADPRVFAVYDVTGDWDSIVLARVKDRQDLDNLTKTVFTLEGVARSYTHVVLNTVKESMDPHIDGSD